MDTIVHSEPTDTFNNETTETDFNSTLLDSATLFYTHTVNTLNDLEENCQKITKIIIAIMSLMIHWQQNHVPESSTQKICEFDLIDTKLRSIKYNSTHVTKRKHAFTTSTKTELCTI